MVVQVLIKHHADVDAGGQRYTPLHFASLYGHPKVARLLLEHGADVNLKSDHGDTPLRFLSDADRNLEVAKLLLDHSADPNARSIPGWNSLYEALRRGHRDLTSLLLKHGADTNARDVDGFTLLYVAPRNGDLKVAQGLLVVLELDVDVNPCDNRGQTPVYVALQKGNEQVVQLLL